MFVGDGVIVALPHYAPINVKPLGGEAGHRRGI